MNLVKIRNLRAAADRADPLPFSYPKATRFRSEKWLRAVASLACVICGKEGTQAAHRNEGKGLGLKTDDCWTAALCPPCHADIDSGKELTRDERRQVMNNAVLDTLCELVRAGKVVAK